MPADRAMSPDTGGTAASEPPRWRRGAAGLLALLFLNGMLSFSTWWPTPGIIPEARLAPEFVWLWLALLAVVAWAKRLSRLLLALFTVAYLLLVLGRYLDVTVPSLFGREINLYWDGAQIPRFLWVSAQDLPWWQSGAVMAAVALFFGLVYWLLRLAIRVAASDAVPLALRTPWAWAATAAATALAVANLAGVRATWPVVSKPVIPTYWRQATLLATALSPSRLAAVLPASSAVDEALAAPAGTVLAGLRGADVYLFMLESYGAVVFDNPRAFKALRPSREQFAQAIASSGRHVVSAFVRAPTFGGGSDLSHMGLLSGIDLSDPNRHDLLLTTERPTLISLFRKQGYQTFGLYPAVRWEWPERAFYGFDHYLESRDLGYRGPPLGYWSLPDQFSMARFEELFPRLPDSPRRFLFFPTITTHLPFSPVPPYQSDWSRITSAQPFDAAETARALAQTVNWLDMSGAYVNMVDYNYRWLAGLMQQPEARSTVFVMVGDHQPAANVTGEGASWDVPVHIIARDPELLARFVALGFSAGLQAPRTSIGSMHELTGLMLRAFAGSDGSVADGHTPLAHAAVATRER